MVDVIIGIGAAFQHDEKNIYRKIWDLDVCAGVSLNHSLAYTDSVDAHELENEPIVAIDPEAGEELYSDFISPFYRDGLSPKIVKTLNTLMDLKVSVALGEGVGISQVKSALHRMLCISSISKTRIIMQNLAWPIRIMPMIILFDSINNISLAYRIVLYFYHYFHSQNMLVY